MSIVRWEPFKDLRFDRLFNEALGHAFATDKELGLKGWAPAVDIYETESSLVLKAELPGIDPKDVEARVVDGTLYLEGQRKFENEVKQDNYHRLERAYGSFTRSFALPSSVDPDKVTAEYKDGVLTLTIAKREEAKPKTIKINVSKN